MFRRIKLRFRALFRRDDIGDALLHVLQLFHLLLVAVVQRLGWVFGSVQKLGDLRLHHG